jgi:hypothetical protein
MEIERFKRIVKAFSDSEADFTFSKGQFLFSLRGDVIAGEVKSNTKGLVVVEQGQEFEAKDWVVNRLARLPLLSDRILAELPEEKKFVEPAGEYLPALELEPAENNRALDTVSPGFVSWVDDRLAGVSSIMYITANAGEGKTTLINFLARKQAKEFKDKKSNWLLIPVSLGGRSFLRLDDIIIGAIANRFRFPLLYYNAFIELVRIGAVVLALDGFEEMFVENMSGDAVSALGNLVKILENEGFVFIAARKAYFEYRSFATQGKLFDSIEGADVIFSKLNLLRWDKGKFLEYCNKSGLPDGEQVYDEVCQRLGDKHPLLTRAVLVKRLAEVAQEDRNRLIKRLGEKPQDYFDDFVSAIIERENREKWIDTRGDPAGPLLTMSEHIDLLTMIAAEMWTAGQASLSFKTLQTIAELFCEANKKSPVLSLQIMERIKQHALITEQNHAQKLVGFDHEEFYDYFLGLAINKAISEQGVAEVRDSLRRGSLSDNILESISHFLRRKFSDRRPFVEKIIEACRGESPASFCRENASGLIFRLIHGDKLPGLVISSMVIRSNSMLGRSFSGILLDSCYFQPCDFADAILDNCKFSSCEFERIEIGKGTRFSNVELHNTRVHLLVLTDDGKELYDPELIRQALVGRGVSVYDEMQLPGVQQVPIYDEKLDLCQRAFRAFLRSTTISENVFRIRLGQKGEYFLKDIMPRLLREGIVGTSGPRGGDPQQHFRLNVRMDTIRKASENSGGVFDKFLSIAAKDRYI